MNHHRETIETWDTLASAYEDRFMKMDLYDDTYDLFCDAVNNPTARVLDIGCGPGNISKYLLRKNPTWRITGLDASANMLARAKANNPSIKCILADCTELSSLHLHFDAVICGFCMPYLSQKECAKLLSDCAAILPENGVLYCSVLEGDYSRSGFEWNSSRTQKMYVHYHDEDFLRTQMENDFHLSHVIRKQYSPGENAVQTHLVLIAKTNTRKQ